MVKQNWLLLIGWLNIFLSGCSYLESYFPDKERDYQYTTEIPMLDWPAELRKNPPEDSSQPADAKIPPETDSSGEADSFLPNDYSFGSKDLATNETGEQPPENQAETAETTQVRLSESDDRNIVASVEILKYDDGESRLRLGAGFAKAWRVVNKSLSRNSIEVTGRSHDQGLITVQYDPEEKQYQDDSFFDEIKFFFNGIGAQDQTYWLKLEEHDQLTDVIVLSEEHLPMLNSEAALRLLKLMADTIKADAAAKKSEPVQE